MNVMEVVSLSFSKWTNKLLILKEWLDIVLTGYCEIINICSGSIVSHFTEQIISRISDCEYLICANNIVITRL